MEKDLHLACTLNESHQVTFRRTSIKEIRDAAQEIQELPDGYAIRLPGEASWCTKLADFIAYERTCCRFLTFELKFEPDEGPIWLRVQGPPKVKEFIQAEATFTDPQGVRPASEKNQP